MHLQLRAIEKTGIERRLAKQERQLQVVLGGTGSTVMNSFTIAVGEQKLSSHTAIKTARLL